MIPEITGPLSPKLCQQQCDICALIGIEGIPPGVRWQPVIWMISFPAFPFPSVLPEGSRCHKEESPLMVRGYRNYCCFHSSITQIQLQRKNTPWWLMLEKWRKQRRKDRRLYKTWGSSSGWISHVPQWFTAELFLYHFRSNNELFMQDSTVLACFIATQPSKKTLRTFS